MHIGRRRNEKKEENDNNNTAKKKEGAEVKEKKLSPKKRAAADAIVAYEVLKYPNLGMRLKLGEQYTVEQLDRKGAKELSALNEKLRDPKYFLPIYG